MINLLRVKEMTTDFRPTKDGFFSPPVAEVNFFYFAEVEGFEGTVPHGVDAENLERIHYTYEGPVWVHNIFTETAPVFTITNTFAHWIEIDSSEIDDYILALFAEFEARHNVNISDYTKAYIYETCFFGDNMECVIEERFFGHVVRE